MDVDFIYANLPHTPKPAIRTGPRPARSGGAKRRVRQGSQADRGWLFVRTETDRLRKRRRSGKKLSEIPTSPCLNAQSSPHRREWGNGQPRDRLPFADAGPPRGRSLGRGTRDFRRRAVVLLHQQLFLASVPSIGMGKPENDSFLAILHASRGWFPVACFRPFLNVIAPSFFSAFLPPRLLIDQGRA